MRHIFFLSLTLIASMGWSHCSSTAGGTSFDHPRPNVIFILADDLGAGDLGCTGHPYAATPNLDKLAERGIRFDRAYMAAAWCAPSRYGLMSGQYPARDFDQSQNLKPDEPSVTSILQQAGYHTAHFGKWHLNKGLEYADSPGDFGIDSHFTTNNNGHGKTWSKSERSQEYWRAKTTDAYVDMAIDFMSVNNRGESPKPFYINLWIYPTHSYIHPTPEQLQVYKDLKVSYQDFSGHQQEFLKFVATYGDLDQAMQAYCADVTAMDQSLGRLFDFLQESNLAQNTMIVFSSDNGPGPLTKQVATRTVVKRYRERPDLLNSVGSAGVYRDRKLSLHEGGIRVPFIVSWPQQLKKSKVDTETIFHGVDWLPTVASICGAKLPPGKYDGMDLKSAFLGGNISRNGPLYWSQKSVVSCLEGDWKAYVTEDDQFQLYNLKEDPSQLRDVKADYSEVAERMEVAMRDWYDTMHR